MFASEMDFSPIQSHQCLCSIEIDRPFLRLGDLSQFAASDRCVFFDGISRGYPCRTKAERERRTKPGNPRWSEFDWQSEKKTKCF